MTAIRTAIAATWLLAAGLTAADTGGTLVAERVPCGGGVIDQVRLQWRIATVLGAPLVTSQVAWRGSAPPPQAAVIEARLADGTPLRLTLHPIWPGPDGTAGPDSSESPRWGALFSGASGPLPAAVARRAAQEGLIDARLVLVPADASGKAAEDDEAIRAAQQAARDRLALQRQGDEERQQAERASAQRAAEDASARAGERQAEAMRAGAEAAAGAADLARRHADDARAARSDFADRQRADLERSKAEVEEMDGRTKAAGQAGYDPIGLAILQGQQQMKRDLEEMNRQADAARRRQQEAQERRNAEAAERRRQTEEQQRREREQQAAQAATAERQRQAAAEAARQRAEADAKQRAAAAEKADAARYADVRYPLNDARVSGGSWPKGVSTLRNVRIGAARIGEFKVGFHFDSLMGEPLVTAITNWTRADAASPECPGSLEITLAVTHAGGVACLVVTPLIMSEGKDGFDVPGSPNWDALFTTMGGQPLSPKEAKAAFKSAQSVRVVRIVAK